MQYNNVNKYADAYTLEIPPSKTPFETAQFIIYLKQAAESLFPIASSKKKHFEVLVPINVLERFASTTNLAEIMPDESFFEGFRAAFQDKLKNKYNKPYAKSQLNRTVDAIRYLVNNFFYQRHLVSRKILERKVYFKYKRFLSISKITQNLLIQYENDGRAIDASKKYFEAALGREQFRYQVKREARRLSDYNRKVRVAAVLTMLDILNKKGIENIETSDLGTITDIYRKKNQSEAGKNYLLHLFSVIGNGIDLGLLKNNPFDNFPLEPRKNKIRDDFVLPDQMDKLLNFDSIDWNDYKEVRNRCLAVTIYDTGLRAGAIGHLKVEDAKTLTDGRYQFFVKKAYLKGDKEDKIIPTLFEETVILLKRWIEIRPKLNPQTNHLFISLTGEPLKLKGIEGVISSCCRELKINTFKGKKPSPHTFRHTLATLNTEPYGKAVPLILMQQRLGHTDFQTFEKIYFHNNPLAEMKEYKKLYQKGRKEAFFDSISKEDLFRLLDSLTFARPGSVQDVKKAYEMLIEAKSNQQNNINMENVLTEKQALSLLSAFKLDARYLRVWALKQAIAVQEEQENTDVKRFLYDKKAIMNIVENYLPSDEAFRKFPGSRAQFYRKLKACPKLVIGHTLIHKQALLDLLIGNAKVYQKKSLKVA
ncbi:MAG: tyrosine-type recombinase/integrase [Candidatus Omnitrophota bacterium]|nr:tyrosine-type recombinase/integrase [Candidatus Omnitrophota bacterium]